MGYVKQQGIIEDGKKAHATDLLVQAEVLETCDRHVTHFRGGKEFGAVIPLLLREFGRGTQDFKDMLKRAQAAYDEHFEDKCNPCHDDKD